MGFDLHTHGSADACGSSCMAYDRGRRMQLDAQMSVLDGSPDLFFVGKAIDGMPRVNGGHLIMAQRTSNFLFRQLRRQTYYELLAEARDAQRLLLQSALWHDGYGVPRAYIDHVQIAVEAFQSWYTAPKGAITMPTPGDPSIGLHAVLLTHYSETGAILGFVNSWGRQWGDRGYGTVPFEYVEQYFFDAVVTRRARWGPISWTFHGAQDNSPREIRSRLLTENPRFRGKLRIGNGDNWQTCVYSTLSPTTDEPVACVEIANGFGLKMGWAFFRLCPAASGCVAEVTELFVWPTFRRMGVGRLLDEFAVGCARLWDCSEIRLMMNEADAVLGPPRAAARLFAQSVGYEWKWRQEVGPRRPATAFKTI